VLHAIPVKGASKRNVIILQEVSGVINGSGKPLFHSEKGGCPYGVCVPYGLRQNFLRPVDVKEGGRYLEPAA
jgi:hypothetical protein